MVSTDTPSIVRDEPSHTHGPDLSAVGTDLVICDGETMTYREYREQQRQ
ncbi:hypothetical protein [Halolamina sp.]|jgi:hypothetical protein|nr:hypothetical protein Halar_1443 [halophilic archaeon DL31]